MSGRIENFPVRYIDLTSARPISDCYVGQRATIIGSIWETGSDSKGGVGHLSVSVTDSTGVVIADFFDGAGLPNFQKGQSVACSGTIYEFAGIKHIKDAIIDVLDDSYSEVVPFYKLEVSETQSDVRSEVKKSLEFDKQIFPLFSDRLQLKKEDLLAIHGLSSKEALTKSRSRIKREQIECFCRENNVDCEIIDWIAKKIGLCEVTLPEKRYMKVIQRDSFGDLCDDIRSRADTGAFVAVVCPLAYKTASQRDRLAKSYYCNAKDIENRFFPNISVELISDIRSAKSQNTKRREEVYRRIVGSCYEHLYVGATLDRHAEAKSDKDILIVEDSDRLSTIFLVQLAYKWQGNVVLISNSKNDSQLERLKNLEKSHSTPEIIERELSFRRDGDILGNRINGCDILSLVNIERDKTIFDDCRVR